MQRAFGKTAGPALALYADANALRRHLTGGANSVAPTPTLLVAVEIKADALLARLPSAP